MYKKTFLKNLKEVRKKRKLSQQVVADFLDIQQCTLSKYENGQLEPDIEMLCQLALFYGVSLDWLLGLEDDWSE